MGDNRPLPFPQLWQRLAPQTQQQLCRLLSELVARRLLPTPAKEVEHEPR